MPRAWRKLVASLSNCLPCLVDIACGIAPWCLDSNLCQVIRTDRIRPDFCAWRKLKGRCFSTRNAHARKNVFSYDVDLSVDFVFFCLGFNSCLEVPRILIYSSTRSGGVLDGTKNIHMGFNKVPYNNRAKDSYLKKLKIFIILIISPRAILFHYLHFKFNFQVKFNFKYCEYFREYGRRKPDKCLRCPERRRRSNRVNGRMDQLWSKYHLLPVWN